MFSLLSTFVFVFVFVTVIVDIIDIPVFQKYLSLSLPNDRQCLQLCGDGWQCWNFLNVAVHWKMAYGIMMMKEMMKTTVRSAPDGLDKNEHPITRMLESTIPAPPLSSIKNPGPFSFCWMSLICVCRQLDFSKTSISDYLTTIFPENLNCQIFWFNLRGSHSLRVQRARSQEAQRVSSLKSAPRLLVCHKKQLWKPCEDWKRDNKLIICAPFPLTKMVGSKCILFTQKYSVQCQLIDNHDHHSCLDRFWIVCTSY